MAAVLAFAGFLAIANAVWSRAETYFERAAYLASCTPSATSPATPAQCLELADAPDHLAQAPLNDEALTLSYAATLHSTGTAVMTLGGIIVSLIVGVTGWLVAAAKDP